MRRGWSASKDAVISMAGGDVATTDGASSKVRRIAILVTSLDATAGRQLLMAMPGDLSRHVRRAMTQLGTIDPDEQRQILAEFRNQAISSDSRTPDKENTDSIASSAQEFTESRPMSSDQPADAQSVYRSVNGAHVNGAHVNGAHEAVSLGDRPWQQLDVTTLGDLLRGERATVIAVVLSQLAARHSARLLQELPRAMQREVIVQLTRLGQIDPDALAAIDEHLASRIRDYQHRRADENESVGRMNELLSTVDSQLRQDWQSIIQDSEPMLAHRMGLPPAAAKPKPAATPKPTVTAKHDPAKVDPAVTQATATRPLANNNILDMLANNVVTTVDSQVTQNSVARQSARPTVSTKASSPQANSQAEDNDGPRRVPQSGRKATNILTHRPTSMRFDEILDLPAEQIGEILSSADSDVVLLALAGASPAFMKRFTAMLERQDARALQTRLRQLTAINLADVDEAQRRLCELALQSRAASKPAPLATRAA